jgi:hypothetical protein
MAPEDSNAGSGIMSNTSIGSVGSTGVVSTGNISGMTVGTTDAGSAITAAGQGIINFITIFNHKGTLTASHDNHPGSGSLFNGIIGTLFTTGIINANTAAGLSISTAGGTVNITQSLTNFTIGTLVGTASITAGHFQTVTALHAGPVVNFIEPTVTRTVAATPHVPGGTIPDFSLYYDGTGSGDPKVVVKFNVTTAGNFDLAVTTSAATCNGAGFDLAGVYSSGNVKTGIHNLVIGGNLLLGAVPAGAVSFLTLPANTPGGVQLPQDIVAVAAAGNLPCASIVAKSVPSIAAGFFGGLPAFLAGNTDAKVPLAKTTALSQANDTYQVFFSEATLLAQFLVTGPGNTFDNKKLLFADIVVDNLPITAQVTMVPSGSSTSVSTVAFSGQGASLSTAQPILSMISAIGGSIGDLILTDPHGLANVTADRILGSLLICNGGITGVVQTTVGDLGSAITDCHGNILGVTSILVGGSVTGKILAKGNLVSLVSIQSGIDGVIAADGDIGVIQTSGGTARLNADGSLNRFGGISVGGGVNGQIIARGNFFGDITVGGGLNGRIAAKGNKGEFGMASFRYGILGNVSIGGGISATGAIVSAGLIGDDGGNNIPNDKKGTHLTIMGADKGIIAAGEDINFGSTGNLNQAGLFENAMMSSNLDAINWIFSNGGGQLDVLDPGSLTLIVKDLLALKVVNSKLAGTMI